MTAHLKSIGPTRDIICRSTAANRKKKSLRDNFFAFLSCLSSCDSSSDARATGGGRAREKKVRAHTHTHAGKVTYEC